MDVLVVADALQAISPRLQSLQVSSGITKDESQLLHMIGVHCPMLHTFSLIIEPNIFSLVSEPMKTDATVADLVDLFSMLALFGYFDDLDANQRSVAYLECNRATDKLFHSQC